MCNRETRMAPRLTTPMVALAWSVINCPSEDGEDARTLAKLVLQAAGEQVNDGLSRGRSDG